MNEISHRSVALIMAMTLCLIANISSLAADETKPAAADKAPLTREQMDDLFAQAVAFHKYGRYDEAEAIARRLQAQVPDDRNIKQLLTDIARVRKFQGEKLPGELERKLAGLILPEVNFRDANAQDVVVFLHDETGNLSADKQAVNFVWAVPNDTKLPTVSLSLRQIPILDVLQLVTQLTGLRYRLDPHAVVIYKPEPSQPPATGTNAKP